MGLLPMIREGSSWAFKLRCAGLKQTELGHEMTVFHQWPQACLSQVAAQGGALGAESRRGVCASPHGEQPPVRSSV